MSRRWQGLLALAALGLAAVVLIAVELANGALDYGEERVAEGERLELSDILAMDWFVEGVEGDPSP